MIDLATVILLLLWNVADRLELARCGAEMVRFITCPERAGSFGVLSCFIVALWKDAGETSEVILGQVKLSQ